MWSKWVAWTRIAARIRQCRQAAYLRRARSGIRAWHRQVVQVHWDRLNDGASHAIGEAHKKRERLVRIRAMANFQCKVRRVERRFDPNFRVVIDGCKHLRAAWTIAKLRQAMNVWFGNVWMEKALEAAREHHERQLLRKVMTGMSGYLRRQAKQRRREEEDTRLRYEAQRKLAMAMAEVEEELSAERRREEEAVRRKREAVSASLRAPSVPCGYAVVVLLTALV
jgi:hypothetical protein